MAFDLRYRADGAFHERKGAGQTGRTSQFGEFAVWFLAGSGAVGERAPGAEVQGRVENREKLLPNAGLISRPGAKRGEKRGNINCLLHLD